MRPLLNYSCVSRLYFGRPELWSGRYISSIAHGLLSIWGKGEWWSWNGLMVVGIGIEVADGLELVEGFLLVVLEI